MLSASSSVSSSTSASLSVRYKTSPWLEVVKVRIVNTPFCSVCKKSDSPVFVNECSTFKLQNSSFCYFQLIFEAQFSSQFLLTKMQKFPKKKSLKSRMGNVKVDTSVQ